MSRGFRGVFAVAAAAGVLAVTGLTAGASNGFNQLQGSFSTTTFSGAGCSSPIDLCAEGEFRGTLNGPITAVATSLAPTSQPGIFIGVADAVIHDTRGDVFCTETFILNLSPGSDGEEGVVCQVTGGTGHWAGASGYINGYGATLPGEPTTGRYGGKLIVP